jgi:uncharacterized protein YjdB
MRAFMLTVTGLVLAVAACSSYGTSVVEVSKTQAQVASVSLSIPSSLVAGQKARAIATPKDANGTPLTGRPITWYTSSASIASVTDSGLISAMAPGTAVVSAVSEGVSGQATMAVTPPAPTPVATVSVALNPPAVLVGQTATATATVADSSGNILTGRVVAWGSSNAAVASVDATGAVRALSAGSALIQATSEGKSSSTPFNVSAPAPIPVASVSVSPPSATLQVGGTVQLSATTYDASNNVLTGRVVGWSSANSAIATVSSSGLVRAVAGGSVSITAASEGQSAASAITVSPPPVATVSVSPASPSIQVGATVQLSAVTRDANNNVLTGRVVTWSSSNTAVGTVSTSGLVTGVAAGSATITATSEGKTATSSLTVTTPAPVPVATVSVSPATATLQIGGTQQLSATTRDANNNVLTGRVVTWSSANTAIATVSASGLVTAVAAGSATITATSETKTGSALVTVAAAPAPVATVTVSPAAPSVQAGSTVQLSAVTRDANNNVLTGRVVTWSSANTSIAGISASGLVTALVVGSVQVTATSEGKTGTSSITVTAAPPPPPPGSAEPTGMNTITERPFSAISEGGWGVVAASGCTCNFSIVSDPTAPKSPSSIGQILYPAGFAAGGEPVNVYTVLSPQYRTLYVGIWLKMSSNFQGNPTLVNKMIHLFTGGSNHVVPTIWGSDNGMLQAGILLQGIVTDGTGKSASNLYPNLGPTGEIVRGQWHHLEYVLVGNTSGTANGSAEWWLDGVKVGSYSNMQFVSGSSTWEQLAWAPTWGGVIGTVNSAMTESFDHIRVSGK